MSAECRRDCEECGGKNRDSPRADFRRLLVLVCADECSAGDECGDYLKQECESPERSEYHRAQRCVGHVRRFARELEHRCENACDRCDDAERSGVGRCYLYEEILRVLRHSL